MITIRKLIRVRFRWNLNFGQFPNKGPFLVKFQIFLNLRSNFKFAVIPRQISNSLSYLYQISDRGLVWVEFHFRSISQFRDIASQISNFAYFNRYRRKHSKVNASIFDSDASEKREENSVVALRSLLNLFACGQVSSPRLYRLRSNLTFGVIFGKFEIFGHFVSTFEFCVKF